MARGRRNRSRKRKPRRSKRRTALRILVFMVAVLIAGALAGLGWLTAIYPKSQASGRGRELRIDVRSDMDLDELAFVLGDHGAIESPFVFAMYARLLGADEHLRTGEILLTDDMTPRDVLQRVAIGFGQASIRVVIPEGFHRFAIAARLERWGICEADAFIAATEDRALLDELEISGPTAEGYLFPDTYRISPDLGAEGIVRRLVDNHRSRVADVHDSGAEGLADLEHTLGWTEHEVLILASIVEKEAAVAHERPIIARVFINRLRDPEFRPKRLQADPSVSYGCLAERERAPSCARFERAITRAMLRDAENRYNTYRHEGLPPGPICNPGLDSIRAVLEAEPHDYLYFVARGGGRHAFSATLEEHNAAVARWRNR